MKLEFSRQIFEEYSNTNFQENPSRGRRVVPCGRKDRHAVTYRNFCDGAWRVHAFSSQDDAVQHLTNICPFFAYFNSGNGNRSFNANSRTTAYHWTLRFGTYDWRPSHKDITWHNHTNGC